MKKNYLIILFMLSVLMIQAQTNTTKPWNVKGKASINVNQNYFSNWAEGGQSAYGLIGKFTLNADYKKDKYSWTNWLDLALGYSVIGDSKPVKTDDKIEFISNLNRDINDKWKYSLVGSFLSQMAKGYDYATDSTHYISKFLAPATATIGVGIQYQPNEHITVNYSPLTASWIIVNDQDLADNGSFGVDPAQRDSTGAIVQHASKVRTMLGSKLIFVAKYEVMKNVDLNTKLELFSDYLKNPQNIDVDWQVALGMKVNKWLNVNINTQLKYDDDIMITDKNGNTGPRTQFKQLLMLGLGYSF